MWWGAARLSPQHPCVLWASGAGCFLSQKLTTVFPMDPYAQTILPWERQLLSPLFPCAIWEELDILEAHTAFCEPLQGLKGAELAPAHPVQTVLGARFGTGNVPIAAFGAAA